MHILKIDNSHKENSMTFEAMKPNQFKGLDYAVVRKFKAPVEKFHGMSDFQAWARNCLRIHYRFDYKCCSTTANLERKFAINKWKEFIESKKQEWSPSKCLLVFVSMMKNLKFSNEETPPAINNDVLDDSLAIYTGKLALNKDMQFDFNKLYKTKLKTYFMDGLPQNYTGWVKILPKKLDPENYEHNVELLKILSNKNWCTKRDTHAKSHLENNEMHIYLEKGKPMLGVRISGCEVQEVQGEKNNSIIPPNYINELKKYIDESDYLLSDDLEFMIELSRVMD